MKRSLEPRAYLTHAKPMSLAFSGDSRGQAFRVSKSHTFGTTGNNSSAIAFDRQVCSGAVVVEVRQID